MRQDAPQQGVSRVSQRLGGCLRSRGMIYLDGKVGSIGIACPGGRWIGPGSSLSQHSASRESVSYQAHTLSEAGREKFSLAGHDSSSLANQSQQHGYL